ncbi:LysR substrate-binding domain-containing protein [Pseudodonghicola flavimaris]|uniref:LysR substrate-binding domain-containing protein n=1 Tax=Pseudodonghicola flavimaris TaxID=3050036 RepID=A0ABT7EX21_9RHOB|nr:LysR substrate-binding domain-containing protein [Pseudodonghicola flavimaris]MDK3016878.1 LysR substrate-binding domain-containing protein [Pseudodonghicola flavimaris]
MKRGTLPLNALRAFEATMRHGQMSHAAEELGVTHGAVSRQIRGLEQVLGVPLFEGPRNRLVPTDAARALQPSLTEAFDRIETAVLRTMHTDRRVLDVSCLSTLTMRWLIPRLAAFQAEQPEIEVRLTADDAPVDFTRQRFDVAIRVGPGPWGAARALPLFADLTGPVLSPALCDSLRDPAALDDPAALLGLPTLHTRTRMSAWPDWCAQQGLPVPEAARIFEHFYFMLEAATAGLGVAIAPEVLVRDDLAAGRLLAPFGFRPSGQTYVALTPEQPSRDAACFTTWLQRIATG